MAKTKTAIAYDNGLVVDRDAGPSRTWANSHGAYIAGRAYLDEADATAAEMEAKWGCGRLRLLVPPELREKFDRQRYLFNQAVWHGDLEGVRREAQRMVKAWLALDRAAAGSGHEKLSPLFWETTLSDGSVAAIVPDDDHAHAVVAEGRKVSVYTLAEIGRLLSGYPALAKVKHAFPGATVEAVRRSVSDPLLDIDDSSGSLDEAIPF